MFEVCGIVAGQCENVDEKASLVKSIFHKKMAGYLFPDERALMTVAIILKQCYFKFLKKLVCTT